MEVEVDESGDVREKTKRKKKQNSKSSKKMKKDYGMFDESDVKIDSLNFSSLVISGYKLNSMSMSNENLKPQKIKVASNLLDESRVITVDEPGSKFSYPESTSECENVKKEKSEDEAEDTVFDVKEKIKAEKTSDCVMLDEPDIKIEMPPNTNDLLCLLTKQTQGSDLVQFLKERCYILDHIIKVMKLQKRCAENCVMLDKPEIEIEMSPNLIQLLKHRRYIMQELYEHFVEMDARKTF